MDVYKQEHSRYVYSVSYFHFVPTIFAFLLVRQIGCLFVVYYIFNLVCYLVCYLYKKLYYYNSLKVASQ